MPRLSHGANISLNALEAAGAVIASHNPAMRAAFPPTFRSDLQGFDFLFPQLQQDAANLLPESPQTVQHLRQLGEAMGDPGSTVEPQDSGIPAVYTYFGQFLDHDITLEGGLSDALADLSRPDLAPLPQADIRAAIRNLRSAATDLDSVYGTGPSNDPNALVPYDGDKLVIGKVTPLNVQQKPRLRPPGKDDFNDLPRKARSSLAAIDREARIGDHRNDENVIVAQLHLAFLRAHNALVDQGNNFKKAQRLLRQHYQHIIIHDFLKRVADPAIVDRIIDDGNQLYDPERRGFFMPLEFSFAAYRFGHTMARDAYDYNLNFNISGEPGTFPASFALLFTFTALSSQIGDFDTLPDNWIIEWENLIDAAKPGGTARRIDTKLAPELFNLRNALGEPLTDPQGRVTQIMRHLAVRNLLRGYLVRIPTGQAVAGALGIPALTPQEIEQAAASQPQVDALRAGGFLEQTPLWYYVLVEAAARTGGKRLGPVGSTLIAEVLVGLVRRSEDSILKGQRRWKPSLPGAQRGTFTLPDLLRHAGVLPGT